MCLSCSSRSWGTLKDVLDLETLPGADTCCTLFPGILTLIALVVRCLLRNRFSNGVTVPSICKSFQVVSFALGIVCRRKIGCLSASWVSGCFIGWSKIASWKGPLMRSREAMLCRHSVILIIFEIGCRNICLRKERTSMRNQLKTCWGPACQRNRSPTSPPVRLLTSLRRLNRRPPQNVRPMTAEQKAKTACISYRFYRMPAGCVHGEKCQHLHEPAPSPSWGSGGVHPSNCQ